jgi:uncharacterized protein (TIGR02246 family)
MDLSFRTLKGENVALLLLASVAAFIILSTIPASADSADDEIKSMVDRFRQAWESLDLEGLESLFDLDYDIRYFPAEMMRAGDGKRGLREYLKNGVQHLSDVKLTVKDIKTDTFGEVAYAAYLWHFEYRWDGQPSAADGRNTMIFRKTDGGWKIIHYHESVPTQ